MASNTHAARNSPGLRVCPNTNNGRHIFVRSYSLTPSDWAAGQRYTCDACHRRIGPNIIVYDCIACYTWFGPYSVCRACRPCMYLLLIISDCFWCNCFVDLFLFCIRKNQVQTACILMNGEVCISEICISISVVFCISGHFSPGKRDGSVWAYFLDFLKFAFLWRLDVSLCFLWAFSMVEMIHFALFVEFDFLMGRFGNCGWWL